MKTLVFITIMFCTLSPNCGQDTQAETKSEQREKLVLLPFSLHGVSVKEGTELTKRFADVMKQSDRFDVAIADSNMGLHGTSSTGVIAEIGRVLGAQKVVQVDIVRREKLTILLIRLVNVSNGALLYAERVDHPGDWEDLVSRVIPEQARKLSSAHLDAKTPWWKAAFLFGACVAAIVWIFWFFERKENRQATALSD